MTTSQKDIIYVDVDDEITAIIEKLQASGGKIVALVLPKRATVFQSIVNMKLLKRTADSAKKNIVLVTSERSIMPLAGAVGVHVASTPQSKPTIPAAPVQSDAPVSVDEIEVGEPEEAPSKAPAATGLATASVAQFADDAEETIEIDDDEPAKTSKKAAAGVPFNKKLKVPDFNKFRNKLLLGAGLLALLIVVLIFANVVLPKATVKIKTNNVEIADSVDVVSSPNFNDTDTDAGRVPGALKEFKKTEIQKAAATGQKDMGTKATGTATFTSKVSCSVSQPNAVPAGTTITSGNFSFVTETTAVFTFTGNIEGSPPNVKCTWKSGSVEVVASKPGDSYNLSSRDYSVAGRSDATAKGSTMKGGTSKIVKVVSQQDIDNLKNKIVESVNAVANQEVRKLLEDENYFALTDSFTTKDPVVTSNPGVDAEADEVTVSITLTYTMAGAKRDGLEELLKAALEKKINPDQQKILNNGLDSAGVRINSKDDKGEVSFQLDVKAVAGVEQNVDDIRQAIAGKKKSEAEAAIRAREGVEDVSVSYSPFWVSKVPSNVNKITIEFENQTSDSDSE
jgi:hypothetical protein